MSGEIKRIIIYISTPIILALIFYICLFFGDRTNRYNIKMKIYPLFCTKEGYSASNISLGPEGRFGKCCPGLEPKARPEDMYVEGKGPICTKVK